MITKMQNGLYNQYLRQVKTQHLLNQVHNIITMFTPNGSLNSHCGSSSSTLHCHTHIHTPLELPRGLGFGKVEVVLSLSQTEVKENRALVTSFTRCHGGDKKKWGTCVVIHTLAMVEIKENRALVTNIRKVSSMYM